MGFHEICRNLYYHFNRDKEIIAERIEKDWKTDIIYQEYCLEWGCLRIVYGSKLKKRNVIEHKTTNI